MLVLCLLIALGKQCLMLWTGTYQEGRQGEGNGGDQCSVMEIEADEMWVLSEFA